MANAWVTLATNDGYGIGALVLAHSLRQSGTTAKIHVLFTEGVSEAIRGQLRSVFDDSTLVNVLDSSDSENLALIGRPDLGVTFTKLHCWRLTQYSKCVFLDADTLVLQNSDELFERPEFAAAPDIGWPDFFNSGVFVFVPSQETYHNLLQFALQHGSFDGGDQGLLNQYFSNWRELDASHRLPFIYNVTSGAIYSYAAALKKLGTSIKIVHFLGSVKPWHRSGHHGHVDEHWSRWQRIFDDSVKFHVPQGTSPQYISFVPSIVPQVKVNTDVVVDAVIASVAVSASSVSVSLESTPTKLTSDEVITKEERYSAWDQGAPDYAGKDSFANIQKQIEDNIQEKLTVTETEIPPTPQPELPSPQPEVQDPVEEAIPDSQAAPEQTATEPEAAPVPQGEEPQASAPGSEEPQVPAAQVEEPQVPAAQAEEPQVGAPVPGESAASEPQAPGAEDSKPSES